MSNTIKANWTINYSLLISEYKNTFFILELTKLKDELAKREQV